jgi:hypothetical protein
MSMFMSVPPSQTPFEPEATKKEAPSDPRFNLDQLNHHVLLTVQAINQAAAVVSVRGA